jgi:MOSC domain-containing protein YiiM
MKVKSVNIGQAKEVVWNNKTVKTGIYKYPTKEINLGYEDVEKDHVVDRKYHGGIDQACYLYSADHYPFWKEKYPDLEWNHGMFGENITIEGFDESKIFIGDIYRIGGATIRITHPRNPCFKLGIRFNDQGIIKEYINSDFPGVYCKVLEHNSIKADDSMELIERQHNSVDLLTVWKLLYQKPANRNLIEEVLELHFITDTLRDGLEKRLKL